MVRIKLDWASTATGIAKIIAFITSVIALTLYHRYANTFYVFMYGSIYEWQFCSVIAPTTSFILLYFFISYMSDESKPGQHFITEVFFNIFHALLNLIAGCILISAAIRSKWQFAGEVKAAGSLYVVLALIHLVDGFFLFKCRSSAN